ncbi:hypothetical protein TL16_g13199 [Triparma laevis f. inornata]|uniref:Uncharacterized protein n=1 Tax=Triparma laevis f. inornata TaxID=1714386 RepID=A0A9W7EZ00_9STRA|nr:hypothetical protein TL16_g13199 [Triparma laevis f. inornata]
MDLNEIKECLEKGNASWICLESIKNEYIKPIKKGNENEEVYEWLYNVWEVLESGKRKSWFEHLFGGKKGMGVKLRERRFEEEEEEGVEEVMSRFVDDLVDGEGYLMKNTKLKRVSREFQRKLSKTSSPLISKLREEERRVARLEEEVEGERKGREDLGCRVLKGEEGLKRLEEVNRVLKGENVMVRKGGKAITKENRGLIKKFKGLKEEVTRLREEGLKRNEEWAEKVDVWSATKEGLEAAVKEIEEKLNNVAGDREEEKTYLRILESRLGEIKFDQGAQGDKKTIKELKERCEGLERGIKEEKKKGEGRGVEVERLEKEMGGKEEGYAKAMEEVRGELGKEIDGLRMALGLKEEEAAGLGVQVEDLRACVEREREERAKEWEEREKGWEEVLRTEQESSVEEVPPPPPPPPIEDMENMEESVEKTLVEIGREQAERMNELSEDEVLKTVQGDLAAVQEKMTLREEEEEDYLEIEESLRKEEEGKGKGEEGAGARFGGIVGKRVGWFGGAVRGKVRRVRKLGSKLTGKSGVFSGKGKKGK